MAHVGRTVKRSDLSRSRPRVRIRARIQQNPHHLRVTRTGSVVQPRVPGRVYVPNAIRILPDKVAGPTAVVLQGRSPNSALEVEFGERLRSGSGNRRILTTTPAIVMS